MRTSLDHLPPDRQRELDFVRRMILTKFEDAHGRSKTGWKKKGRIHKIVLYGSFARGDWVYEPDTKKGYISDYDLMVVVNRQPVVDNVNFWTSLDEYFADMQKKGRLKSLPSLIVHTRSEVHHNLVQGRYLFSDIAKEGILLYDADEVPFPEAKPKTAADKLAMAQGYFDDWYPKGAEFFDLYEITLKKGQLSNSAYQLHQSVENLYNTALLVLTFYSPHNHNIRALRSIANTLDRRLIYVWPSEYKWQMSAFNILRDGYVKGRYHRKTYRISVDQLVWLGEMTQELARVVLAICSERLAELRAEVIAAEGDRASGAAKKGASEVVLLDDVSSQDP